MTTNTNKQADGLNVIDYGKKIYDVWDKETLLGLMATPFGITFGVWFFTREAILIELMKWLGVSLAIVGFASAIKHIINAVLASKYKIRANELYLEIIDAKTEQFKTVVESHFKMEMTMVFANQAGYAMDSIIENILGHLKIMEGDENIIIRNYYNTLSGMRARMKNDTELLSLPFKEYITEVFSNVVDDYYNPDMDTMPDPKELMSDLDITPDMIRKKAEDIQSTNPTAKDLEKHSKDLGYDV